MASSGKTVYHYLDIGRLGRGQVVYLFLKDAGIDFEDVRYKYDDTWPKASAELKERGITRTGSLPAVEHNGKTLIGHLPIIRYFIRELGGKYDGETNEEKYIVDTVADIYVDWRAKWVASLAGATDQYKKDAENYYKLVGQYYADKAGPYLLGDKVTYADFAVYQSIDNDKRTGTLPASIPKELEALVEAFRQRPNIGEYLKQDIA